MKLVRVDQDTNLFELIEQQWADQCQSFGAQFDEFASPSIEHAKEIANGKLGVKNYGIYALIDEQDIELIAHFNTARLPQTNGVTLRVVWVLLAPKYDYLDIKPDILARIASALFEQAITLSKGAMEPSMKADHIKVHLTGIADRRFFEGVAYALQSSHSLADVAIRGNWLHMSPR